MDENHANSENLFTCPKCFANIETEIEICPHCGTNVKSEVKDYVKLAQQIAGVVLILNAIFIIIENLTFGPSEQDVGNPFSGVIGSLVIGGYLLSGKQKGLKWARFAVVIGAIIYPIIHFMQDEYFYVVYQIIFSLSLISLLFWNPNKIRIQITSVFLILYFGLEIIGIHAELTGGNFLTSIIMKSTYDLEEVVGNEIQGRNYGYYLSTPENSDWQVLSENDLMNEGTDADMWLMNPYNDSHIMVIAESSSISLNFYSLLVLSMLESSFPDLKITDSSTVTTNANMQCKIIDIAGRVDDFDAQYKYGIFSFDSCVYQIICLSEESSYPLVEEDFNSVIHSFSNKSKLHENQSIK